MRLDSFFEILPFTNFNRKSVVDLLQNSIENMCNDKTNCTDINLLGRSRSDQFLMLFKRKSVRMFSV